MPIPTYEQAMLPVLKSLSLDAPKSRREIVAAMADYFELTTDERERLLPSGKAPMIVSRVGWALTYLKQAALLTSPKRGIYRLTDRGRDLVASSPPEVDSAFLERFPEFREFQGRSRAAAIPQNAQTQKVLGAAPALNSALDQLPPEEALQEAYLRLKTNVESELLDAVKAVTPQFFERIVIDLLVKMGYGGSREEAARAVGRSGDGGIDGVIDEDRLGLDVINVQAKKWEGSVGRPEIQKFAGALQGQRAKKGIFITTSTFTRDAEDYAQRIDTRIVLIDGRRLASLMFDANVGVSAREVYTVKSIDGDYFEEA